MSSLRRVLVASWIAVAAAGPFALRATADDPLATQASAEEAALVDAIGKALKSFVFIGARGSGVLVSADGFVLTNDHVAGSMPSWRVRVQDGTTYTARLVGTDPTGDISLLKIEGKEGVGFPYLELADSDAAQVGETVIAIGNPFGLSNIDEQPTVTVGLISALNRPQIHKGLPDSIMTDAPLNPGNSGGPLIDMQGRLVGINGQIHTRFETRSNTGIGYAISSNQIKRLMPILQAANGGMIKHGYLSGLRFKGQPGQPEIENVGYEELMRYQHTNAIELIKRLVSHADQPVSKVTDDAAKAGIQVGDVIVSVDGHAVATPIHAIARFASYPAGAKAVVSVRRGGAMVDIPVSLTAVELNGQVDLGLVLMNSSGRDLLITEVAPGTPAATAGVQVGDQLLSMSGIDIRAPNEAILKLWLKSLNERDLGRLAASGAATELSVLRAGKPITMVMVVPKGATTFGFTLALSSAPSTPEDASKLRVKTVAEGGPASKAGVVEGDRVVGMSVEGTEHVFATVEDMANLISPLRPGTPVKILVEREGKRKVLDLTLGLKRELP